MKTDFLFFKIRDSKLFSPFHLSQIFVLLSVSDLFPFHVDEIKRGFTAGFEVTVQFEVNFLVIFVDSSYKSFFLVLFSARGECSFSNVQLSFWIMLNYTLAIQQSLVHLFILNGSRELAASAL